MLLVCVLGIDRQLQEMTPEVLTGREHLSQVFWKIAGIEPGLELTERLDVVKDPHHVGSSSESLFLKAFESSLLSRIKRCRYCRFTPDSLAA